MAGLLDIFRGPRPKVGPFQEAGVGGTACFGGVISRQERNGTLTGTTRWRTASDILTNMSIVAAGTRHYLNAISKPSWKVVPAGKSDAAKYAADFAESLLHGMDTSWSRTVRRNGLYCYHGYGMHEWVAKKRDDGLIGFRSLEPRPVQTIVRWDIDPNGSVMGVWQRSPQDGHEIYLPREKLVYQIDDALTDSPEGMGWFRHLVEPSNRLKMLLRQEGIGFQRDMAGVPVGRAPIAAMDKAIAAQLMTTEDKDKLIAGLEDFIRTKVKEEDSSLMLDSQPFSAINADGTTQISSVMQWGVELLTGNPGTIKECGEAIDRTTWDMALIMGIQSLLIGRKGAGSLALAQDASQTIATNINSTTGDMAECFDRDLLGPAWAYNGLDPAIRPKLAVEDASFKDVESIARTLADMATAGAVLMPDDPAINDVRDLAGLSHQPEMTPERMGMLMPAQPAPGAKPNDKPDPDPTDPNADKPEKK